jgi:S-formylglutathione hydrolase FrmB
MILTTVNFHSETLGLRSQMNVILPQRKMADAQAGPAKRYKVLYLLHGLSDDHTAWQRWTSIERYVEPFDMAVIMPAVGRSFYTDMACGTKYWTFVSEELPLLVRDLFPVSEKREDTFVAGLSMGGYGAFKLALSHPHRFAAAASFSGALDVRSLIGTADGVWLSELRTIFGDLERVAGGPRDLFTLAVAGAKSEVRPRLFQYCGKADPLYADNLRFRDFIKPFGYSFTWEEDGGDHTWPYWDAMIQKALVWMTGK